MAAWGLFRLACHRADVAVERLLVGEITYSRGRGQTPVASPAGTKPSP